MPERMIPLAAWIKAWACGRLLADIKGSYSVGGMDVCLL